MTGVDLNSLGSLAKSLNEASDALSKQIDEVEGALNKLKLGVWAWVELWRASEEWKGGGGLREVTRVENVGYGKHQGKWRLLYSVSYDELPDPEYEQVYPLRDAPRMDRIDAVDRIPDLIKALEAKATEVAALAVKKAEEVKGLAAELQKVG